LGEVLRIVHGVTAAAHKSVERRPISLAKLSERDAGALRLRITPPGGDNHTPVGRSERIALVMTSVWQRTHPVSVSGAREKAKHAKKSRFFAARAPARCWKGKAIIASTKKQKANSKQKAK
jgi:hypothetical protein